MVRDDLDWENKHHRKVQAYTFAYFSLLQGSIALKTQLFGISDFVWPSTLTSGEAWD